MDDSYHPVFEYFVRGTKPVGGTSNGLTISLTDTVGDQVKRMLPDYNFSSTPKEIITKETGILVPPKDIEALADAIGYMLDNYQNYSSAKISRYAKENFSYEVVGEKIDEIYRKIMI